MSTPTPESTPPIAAGPYAQPRSDSKTTFVTAGLAAAVGLIVGVLGTLGVQALLGTAEAVTAAVATDTRLVDAYSECGSPFGTELADKNQTLTMDVKGKEDASGASYDDQQCILSELDAPSSVLSHFNQTTSMDGRQTESWDGITVAWSYHPDRGSDMVITLDEPKK